MSKELTVLVNDKCAVGGMSPASVHLHLHYITERAISCLC